MARKVPEQKEISFGMEVKCKTRAITLGYLQSMFFYPLLGSVLSAAMSGAHHDLILWSSIAVGLIGGYVRAFVGSRSLYQQALANEGLQARRRVRASSEERRNTKRLCGIVEREQENDRKALDLKFKALEKRFSGRVLSS